MGKIAANLIDKKEKLEKASIIDSKRFSGFGLKKNDPVAKLHELVAKNYKNEIKKENHNKIQKGGFIVPLVPIAVAGLSALAAKLTNDLYDFVKRKISGKGIHMNHKLHSEKRDFLINLLKSA